jgi:hypothetical protein
MPLSDQELREKFSALTHELISPSRAEAIRNTIEHLEDLSDVSSLTSLLAKETTEGR